MRNYVKMTSCQEPLLKSDDEEELVFDRTGLLSNQITVKPDIRLRGHSSGKRLQYARTINLCLAFFALGLCFAIPTATLKDLQAAVGADLSDIEFIYTARYSGYVFGSLMGGILFDRYNRQFLLFLSLLATAIGIITMPFCTKLGVLMACTAITGITMGFLDTGGNVWCLDLWGKKSAPFMQTLHFCFGLGAFISPLVAEPFLSPHLQNSTGLVGNLGSNSTEINFPHVPRVGFPHQRFDTQHEISSILSHIVNDSETESNKPRAFPYHKFPRYVHGMGTEGKHYVKRDVDENDENTLKNRTDHFATEENKTADLNVTDDPNNYISSSISNFINDSMTSLDETTITSSTTTSASTTTAKQKPKKPFYANGNLLKHDSPWDRDSLKQVSKSESTKQTSSDITSTSTSSNLLDISTKGVSESNETMSNDTFNDLPNGNNSRVEFQSESNTSTERMDPFTNSTSDIENDTFENSSVSVILPTSLLVTNTESISVPTVNVSAYKLSEIDVALNKTNSTKQQDTVAVVTVNPAIFQTEMKRENFTPSSLTTQQITTTETKYTSTAVPPTTKNVKLSINSSQTNNFKSTSANVINDLPKHYKKFKDQVINESDKIYNYMIKDGIKHVNKHLTVSSQESTTLTSSHHGNKYITDSKKVLLDDEEKTNATAPLHENSTANSKRHSKLDFLSNLFEVMRQHRLGKFEIAYVILGVYIFIVAFIFLVFLCLNPREPRSKQEEELDKMRNVTMTFKLAVIVLMSLFLCLYVGIEVAVGQLLQTFTIKQYLQLPESTGYFMTYLFWGSFALARGLSIGLAVKFSGLCLICVDLIVCLVTSILLVAGANKVETLLWVGIVILGFGMAPIFPAAIAWIERYLAITNKIASIFILGAALGQMTIPLIINRFINQTPMVLMYVNIIVNILCFVTFIILWQLASRQGEKYKTKVNRTMYQLANFDDVEDGVEMSHANSHWQNNYNSHILMKKSVGKVT